MAATMAGTTSLLVLLLAGAASSSRIPCVEIVPVDSSSTRALPPPPRGMPDIYNFCCPDVEQGQYGHMDWPTTRVGQTASQPCAYGPRPGTPPHGFAKAHRKCVMFTSVGPVWGPSDYSECRVDGSKEEEAARGAEEAEEITSNPANITGKTFKKAVAMLKNASSLAYRNRTVANTVLRALSNLLDVRPEVLEDTDDNGKQRVDLYSLIDDHGRGVRLADDEVVYEKRLPNLHILVATMPRAAEDMAPSIEFGVRFDEPGSAGPTPTHKAAVQVSLPASLIQKVLDDNPGTQRSEVRVRFAAVRSPHLLRPPGTTSPLQRVVSASVSPSPPSQASLQDPDDLGEDYAVRELKEPVAIRMPMAEWGASHVCAYFDMNSSEWRTDGVRTLLDGVGRGVACESSHLTPFTLLLDPYPRRGLGSMRLAMDVVSYLGSTLSVIGLIATIVTYQFLSRFGEDRWGRVLVQLCWALLLLNLATLASNLKGAMPASCCMGVALLLHLFLLASFFWMLVEGLLLYQLLITVFQSANSKFVFKRLVFAWGLPVLIVAACLAADPRYYLDTHPDYCVASGRGQLQHALATLLPCGAALAANALIFVRISAVLLRRRNPPGFRPDAAARPLLTWAQVRGVVGVAFLLGVTWLLSPLSASQLVGLQVASCALNALQGAAIFVSRVLTHPEARRAWTHRFLPKTEFRTTSASYSVSEKGSSWFRIRWSVTSGTVATPPSCKEQKKPCWRWSSPLGNHAAPSRGSSSMSLGINNNTSETYVL